DQFITSQITALHCVFDALFGWLDELARNRAAFDLVFKNKSFTGSRFNFQLNVRKLTTATGLLLENLLARSRLRDRLAISHLWLPNVSLDAEFALHAIDDNLEM